jgi:hypothetical protein
MLFRTGLCFRQVGRPIIINKSKYLSGEAEGKFRRF